MKYVVEVASGDMIHTKFHEVWYRRSKVVDGGNTYTHTGR
jgi:hypothetical protein